MLRTTRPEPSTLFTLAFLMWGLLAWGAQFMVVYIAHTLLCALGASAGATDIIVAILTAVACVAILPVAAAPVRVAVLVGLKPGEDTRHLAIIARTVAVLALAAVLWTGATALAIQACQLGR